MDCQGHKKWQYLITDLEKTLSIEKHNEYEK